VPLTGTVEKPVLDQKAIGKHILAMAAEALKRRAVQEFGNILKDGLKLKK
jgi:hypothetical protein